MFCKLKKIVLVVLLLTFQSSQLFAEAGKSFFQLEAASLEGQKISFDRFKGKVILVANTASGCGYTPQYKNLQALTTKYGSKGLVVLGFPSNDFGGQEPGTNQEIKKFCDFNYKINFQLFTKLPVSGQNIQPTFQWLTENSPKDVSGPVEWNFEKFLISKNGKIVQRYRSKVSPESPEVISALEGELKK